jgi:hypothetical protein
VLGADGNFYGVTLFGGTPGYGSNPHFGPTGNGTIYKITPTGIETVLYAFTAGADDMTPLEALIQGTDWNFYGTTNGGGTGSLGTVFRY